MFAIRTLAALFVLPVIAGFAVGQTPAKRTPTEKSREHILLNQESAGTHQFGKQLAEKKPILDEKVTSKSNPKDLADEKKPSAEQLCDLVIDRIEIKPEENMINVTVMNTGKGKSGKNKVRLMVMPGDNARPILMEMDTVEAMGQGGSMTSKFMVDFKKLAEIADGKRLIAKAIVDADMIIHEASEKNNTMSKALGVLR
jgi:hypothetical protein